MSSKKKTLLIVDDEPSVHRAIARTLRREPYELLHAEDAAEAWALLRDHPEIDAVVCDHYMPGTTGLELVLDIRARYPHLATMMLTAQADLKLVLDAINQGRVHRFHTKPWDGDAMRKDLRVLLGLDDDLDDREEQLAETERRLEAELAPWRDDDGAFVIEPPT